VIFAAPRSGHKRTQGMIAINPKARRINSAGWSSPVARWAHNFTALTAPQLIQSLTLRPGARKAAPILPGWAFWTLNGHKFREVQCLAA